MRHEHNGQKRHQTEHDVVDRAGASRFEIVGLEAGIGRQRQPHRQQNHDHHDMTKRGKRRHPIEQQLERLSGRGVGRV